MVKVMFVCHGNICRSPMAEFVLKDMVANMGLTDNFLINSSATSTEEIGNDIHYGTKNKLRQMGIPFTRRAARKFTVEDYKNYDYILLMDENNVRNLFRIIGADVDKKVAKLGDYSGGGNIADPWYTGNFDDTYRDVEMGCKAFLDYLKDRKVI